MHNCGNDIEFKKHQLMAAVPKEATIQGDRE